MNLSPNASALLHLSLIDGVGAATLACLSRNQQEFELSQLYAMDAAQLREQFGISPLVAAKIVQGLQDTTMLERELALLEQHAVTLTTIFCNAYPALLKTIHLAPPILYSQGAPFIHDERACAFVGSRQANYYGAALVDRFVPPLVREGWTIVSGGALGIDGMVHQATLNVQGRTIVVLGSGLLRLYPPNHASLFKRIVEQGGTLVSAFPLEMEAFAGNFPARNRIIAGLSKACVVLQAAAKSGALITAQFALEQGREVCAVPGAVDDPLSQGCHALLKSGATLVETHTDILEACGYAVPKNDKAAQKTLLVDAAVSLPQSARVVLKKPEASPSTPEGVIIGLCRQACSLDELTQRSGLPIAELQEKLFALQLEGKVAQNFMGMWQAQ